MLKSMPTHIRKEGGEKMGLRRSHWRVPLLSYLMSQCYKAINSCTLWEVIRSHSILNIIEHKSFSWLIAWFFSWMYKNLNLEITKIINWEMRFPLEYVIFLLIRPRKSNSENISVIMLFCAWQCEIGLAAELI